MRCSLTLAVDSTRAREPMLMPVRREAALPRRHGDLHKIRAAALALRARPSPLPTFFWQSLVLGNTGPTSYLHIYTSRCGRRSPVFPHTQHRACLYPFGLASFPRACDVFLARVERLRGFSSGAVYKLLHGKLGWEECIVGGGTDLIS